MENNLNKFQKIINFLLKYGIIIVSILVFLIGFLSIFITAYFNSTFYHPEEKTSFKYCFGAFQIISVLFIIFFIFILFKKILKKIPSIAILITILVCSFGLYLYWIDAIRLNPETDQKVIEEMAISFLEGNINKYTDTAQYLFLYPYQFGLTLLFSLIYKIFGTNFIYIHILNAICSIINLILIYIISKIIFKEEKIQKLLTFFIGGFSLYWMFFNVHYYGNIIGLTLGLLALLFTILYLDKRKFYNLIISGCFIGISILMKTNYSIFLCGIILVLLLDIIQKWNFKIILIIPIFLIGYLFINTSYSLFVSKILKIDLPDGMPMIAFVYMGMAPKGDLSAGWYTGDTVDIYRQENYNNKKTTAKTLELIKTRSSYLVTHPSDLVSYYSEKFASTWLNPTFQTVWCSLPGTRYRWYKEYADYLSYHQTALSMVGGNLYKAEEFYFDIYQILTFITASIGIFKISKDHDYKKILLPIIFAGGLVFHLIWETKAIYVIQYYFLLLPYSAYGLNYIYEKIENKFNKNKKSLD